MTLPPRATCPEFVPAARPAAHLFTQRSASVERRVPGHKPGSQLIVAVTTVSHNSSFLLGYGGKYLFFEYYSVCLHYTKALKDSYSISYNSRSSIQLKNFFLYLFLMFILHKGVKDYIRFISRFR